MGAFGDYLRIHLGNPEFHTYKPQERINLVKEGDIVTDKLFCPFILEVTEVVNKGKKYGFYGLVLEYTGKYPKEAKRYIGTIQYLDYQTVEVLKYYVYK